MNMSRRCAALLIVLTAVGGCGRALAELPAVPDPQAWSALPPDVRETRARTLREQLKSASPEERRQFRERLRQRLSALPPDLAGTPDIDRLMEMFPDG